MRWRLAGLFGIVVLAVILVTAGLASGKGSARTSHARANATANVTVALAWVTQAEFAGYYAAKAKGYYKAANLNVKIVPGGPNAAQIPLLASGKANFVVETLGTLLAARDQGIDIKALMSYWPDSGYRLIYWKKSGIKSFKDLKGKQVGIWTGSHEVPATIAKYGYKESDFTLVPQQFDMVAFLTHKLDAASATIYNEIGQVLAAGVKPSQLGVINFGSLGTALASGVVMAQSKYITQNRDVAVRFLAATIKGWAYCRTHLSDCVNIVLAQGPTLGRSAQIWQMNEVNHLNWPAKPGKFGLLTKKEFDYNAQAALKYKVIKQPASPQSYDLSLWQAAVNSLKGVDLSGKSFKPLTLGWQGKNVCSFTKGAASALKIGRCKGGTPPNFP